MEQLNSSCFVLAHSGTRHQFKAMFREPHVYNQQARDKSKGEDEDKSKGEDEDGWSKLFDAEPSQPPPAKVSRHGLMVHQQTEQPAPHSAMHSATHSATRLKNYDDEYESFDADAASFPSFIGQAGPGPGGRRVSYTSLNYYGNLSSNNGHQEAGQDSLNHGGRHDDAKEWTNVHRKPKGRKKSHMQHYFDTVDAVGDTWAEKPLDAAAKQAARAKSVAHVARVWSLENQRAAKHKHMHVEEEDNDNWWNPRCTGDQHHNQYLQQQQQREPYNHYQHYNQNHNPYLEQQQQQQQEPRNRYQDQHQEVYLKHLQRHQEHLRLFANGFQQQQQQRQHHDPTPVLSIAVQLEPLNTTPAKFGGGSAQCNYFPWEERDKAPRRLLWLEICQDGAVPKHVRVTHKAALQTNLADFVLVNSLGTSSGTSLGTNNLRFRVYISEKANCTPSPEFYDHGGGGFSDTYVTKTDAAAPDEATLVQVAHNFLHSACRQDKLRALDIMLMIVRACKRLDRLEWYTGGKADNQRPGAPTGVFGYFPSVAMLAARALYVAQHSTAEDKTSFYQENNVLSVEQLISRLVFEARWAVAADEAGLATGPSPFFALRVDDASADL